LLNERPLLRYLVYHGPNQWTMCVVIGPKVTIVVEEVATFHCELELLDELLNRRNVFVESYYTFLQRSVCAIMQEVEVVNGLQILPRWNVEYTKGIAQVARSLGENDSPF